MRWGYINAYDHNGRNRRWQWPSAIKGEVEHEEFVIKTTTMRIDGGHKNEGEGITYRDAKGNLQCPLR